MYLNNLNPRPQCVNILSLRNISKGLEIGLLLWYYLAVEKRTAHQELFERKDKEERN